MRRFSNAVTTKIDPTLPDRLRSLVGTAVSRLRAREFRRRARVLTFPALLGPLQIFLFRAHALYAGNVGEFSAPFWRLAVHWLPALAAIVAGLIALGLTLPENWFRRYVVALFGFGMLCWLQGGVLVANYGTFTGEALDWERHAWRGPGELGLWVIGLSAMLAAWRKVFAIVPFASQLLIALQAVVLVASAVRSGAGTPEPVPGGFDSVFELSRSRNVIHLVLDGFQSDVFREILESDPVLTDSMSGFVFFADHAGAFRTTIASIPAMLTGEAYRNQEPIRQFIRRVAIRRSLLGVLREHGFETDAVSPHLQGLGPATNLFRLPRPYVSRSDYRRFAAWQLVDLSLFRHAPHVLKRWIYNDESWRLQTVLGTSGNGVAARRRHHAENGRAFLDDFVRRARVGRERPVYKFLHVGIPHLPLVLDAGCGFTGVTALGREGYVDQATCAIGLVTRLLDRLRTLGVYEDSVIILSSDHGVGTFQEDPAGDDASPLVALPRIMGNARALLAVKAAGATGPLRISDAPTTMTDVPATVMDLLGVAESGYPGRSALRIAEHEDRERAYAWYRWEDADWRRQYLGRMDLFSIHGPMSDRESWTYEKTLLQP